MGFKEEKIRENEIAFALQIEKPLKNRAVFNCAQYWSISNTLKTNW